MKQTKIEFKRVYVSPNSRFMGGHITSLDGAGWRFVEFDHNGYALLVREVVEEAPGKRIS